MKEVFRTSFLSEVYGLQTTLFFAGIPATVLGEHSLGMIAGELRLVVLNDADADVAAAIIAHQQSSSTADD